MEVTAALLVILLFQGSQGELNDTQRELQEKMRETCATSIEGILTLRRAGKPDDLKKYSELVELSCNKLIQAAPLLAEPHYHLGRMYRAVMRDEDALLESGKALKISPVLLAEMVTPL
jgi:hypothetical protein